MSKIPQGEWNAIAARYANGESISGIARSYHCTPPAIHYILKRNRQQPGDRVLPPIEGRPAPMLVRAAAPHNRANAAGPPCQSPAKSDVEKFPAANFAAENPVGENPVGENPSAAKLNAAKLNADVARPAATPGLDSALQYRAEAAIEAFRASLDAALAEGSPVVRERLRQAASDLMRVAARTTIVLDRLNAGVDRPGRVQSYPRYAREGGGGFGPG